MEVKRGRGAPAKEINRTDPRAAVKVRTSTREQLREISQREGKTMDEIVAAMIMICHPAVVNANNMIIN